MIRLNFKFVIIPREEMGAVWLQSSSVREVAVVNFLCDSGEAVDRVFGFLEVLGGGEFITSTSLLVFKFVFSPRDKTGSVWARSSSAREVAVVHFSCDSGEAVDRVFGFWKVVSEGEFIAGTSLSIFNFVGSP
mmetsp:Transcript_5303/g.6626  ORF Transcript_5303/g.6626 Transcript_5303/m.6626 type:complete len:133 (+) Transcript_5303:57-455(+)